MIERAARYLNSGAQEAWHYPNKFCQSRRMLHSAFWRHGAGDLDLPTWCFVTMQALFEPEKCYGVGIDGSGSGGSYPHTRIHKPILDFLCPPPTKAMLKRFSSHGFLKWYRNLRYWNTDTNSRRFASLGRNTHKKQKITEQPRNSKIVKSPEVNHDTPISSALTSSEALTMLRNYFAAHDKEKFGEAWSEVWRAFSAIDEAAKTPRLLHGLINILATSTRSLDARRIVRLFDSLPIQDRTPSVSFKTILALLKLKEIGKALKIYDAGIEGSAPSFAATDILLAHFIANRHWQLMFHVWSKCSKSEESENALFEKIVNMPGFPDKVFSLLSFVIRYREILLPASNGFARLISDLVSTVLSKGKMFNRNQERNILDTLKNLNLSRPYFYEISCLQALSESNRSDQYRTSHALEIYDAFSKDPCFQPRQRLLYLLFKAIDAENNVKRMKMLFADWKKFHGVPPINYSGRFMKGFAKVGDLEMVEQILTDYLAHYDERTLLLFYPRLHVHALRAEPDLVWEQMTRMEEKFGLDPDITCWNILLHAYQRTDDLDGALATMSRILQFGVVPDHYTLGTIMSICAARGDVELITELLDVAESHNIPRTTVMKDTYVLALINNDNLQGAKDFVLAEHSTRKDPSTTRMWNQILAAYAIKGDVGTVTSLSKEMQKLNVPFNSMTFAAILRVFTVNRESITARSILQKVMKKLNIKKLAIHYAIVIDGFADELLFERAIRVHAEMLEDGIEPTLSTQLALLKLHTYAVKYKYKIDDNELPGFRFDVPEEALEEFLKNYDRRILANKEPRLLSKKTSLADTYPSAYFDLLLTIYGKSRAYDAVRTLLARLEKETQASTSVREPIMSIGILSTLISLHYRLQDFEQIDRYWELCKDTAIRSSKTGKPFQKGRLPMVRRYLLSRPLDVYIRALSARDEFPKMLQTFEEIFSLGFDLDNRNWNWYVQVLAIGSQYLLAFTVCEQKLMEDWPGWRISHRQPRYQEQLRRSRFGTEIIGQRTKEVLAPGQLLATYTTMVRLAFVIRTLNKEVQFERAKEKVLEEIKRLAPKTVDAVLTMPMTEHPIATHVLGYSPGSGEKRRMSG